MAAVIDCVNSLLGEPAEYSPVLALWLVRLSACRSPGYGGPGGSHACASCPASTSRKKTRAVPRGGRAAACLQRQPITRALTTPPAGTRKRSIAVPETGRCGCADGSVVTGAGLDVPDLAQIPAATSAPGWRRCSARWSRVGAWARTGTLRSGSGPAIRRPAGPGPPPGAGHRDKPAHECAPQRPRRPAQRHYNQ